MKKFKVWLEENNCAIVYGNNISEIMSLYKNKKIEEYDDFYYLTFIEKIISSSKLVCKTTEYKIYKFYIQDGFILIKLFLENSVYLDVAYVQLKTKTHNDNTWTVEKPLDVYNNFIQLKKENKAKRISFNEFKQIKTRFIGTKSGFKYYFDRLGNFYAISISEYPTGKRIDEYNKFNGNTEALYIKYYYTFSKYTLEWFENKNEFYKVLTTLDNKQYEIYQKGYDKSDPMKNLVVLKLPYYNVIKALNNNTSLLKIINEWNNITNKSLLYYDIIKNCILLFCEYKKHKT